MPRDYAKQTTRKRRKKKTTPGWVWLLAGLLVGLFSAGLVYLNQGSHTPNMAADMSAKQLLSKNKAIKTQLKKAKTRFEFYTILPSSQGSNQQRQDESQTNQKENQNSSYVLQVASVKALAAANRLKAQLSLMGFNVQIKAIKVKSTTWHRVDVGPYHTLAKAEQAQDRLLKQHINSIILRVAVKQ